ncbi:ABC transporter permease [Tunicatimonas pelagia]|uniref:ABC transporter permease n=1 Tax=Tunicatimonas pelagia TaxID=931531 RepID=UPI002666D450|nr:ABC transporter permease [Tunicatimonas pelagia]WKN42170.1 ABC transporter permease [Tunicatimonas pelagia]
MLRNYWKTAVRTLWKHKSYTTINVLGLSLGITCSLVLFLLIRHWLSFDSYHTNRDRIYRIVKESTDLASGDGMPGVPLPLPEAFRTDFPAVEAVALVGEIAWEGTLLTIIDENGEAKSFQEDEYIAYVEPQFFQIFDRSFIKGDAATALDEPNEIVLSERQAQKYFGERDPIGQTITLNREKELIVTGVIENYPDNTDLPFDIFISDLTRDWEGHWGSTSSGDQAYVLLAERQSPESIDAQFPVFIEKHYGDPLDEQEFKHYLQPLREMHFDPRFSTYTYQGVSWQTIRILTAVAVFLILIACINFVNLATATATQRAKEVGVRKVLGSTRSQLLRQFLSETTIITILSALIALGGVELLLLKVNPLLSSSLELQLLENPRLLALLIGLVVIISLLSGWYPASVLSGFKPVHTFRNVLQGQRTRGITLRKGLVVLQFIIAQVFIIGTLVLFRQMQYVQQTNLGFRSEAILTMRLPESTLDQKRTFRQQLTQIAAVEKASLGYANPASGWVSATGYKLEGETEKRTTHLKAADIHYLDIFQIPVIAGSPLTTDTDTLTQVLVNETLAASHGLTPEEIVGRTINLWDADIPIVGVVKDFHTRSLREAIVPTVVLNDARGYEAVIAQVSLPNLSETLESIEQQWKTVYPEYTFAYIFADDEIAEFYTSERRLSRLLGGASLVVVFIGCLGLYGLITFMAERKTKEIGVRKVLGASVTNIIGLFSIEFIKLIGSAFVVAAPLVYLVMSGWLQNFTYKIDLGIGLFLIGIGATLIIALLTVSYQSIKAALANPVDSLRNE